MSPRDVVQSVLAGRRLESWALHTQLVSVAELIRRWIEHPPTDDAPAKDAPAKDAPAQDAPAQDARCDTPDGSDAAWAGRVTTRCQRQLASAQSRARFRVPEPEDLVNEFVAAELSAACGLSRTAAGARVLAAQVVFVQGLLPRTARMLQAGLLDWPKLQLLVTRVGLGRDPALAALVEALVIQDTDLALADRISGPDPDPAILAALDTGAVPLPVVARMTVPALGAAVDAALAALDPDAADAADRAREQRRVTTRTDPDGMGRLEASTGQEHIAAMWNSLTAAAHAAKKAGDQRSIDQLRLDELVRRVSGCDPYRPGTPAHQDRAADVEPDSTTPDVDPDSTTPDVDPVGRCTCGGAPSASKAVLSTRYAVSLTLPLSTFLGVADDPATLDGYGPLAGALARRIAHDAARDAARAAAPDTSTGRRAIPRIVWRCVITNDLAPPGDPAHGTVLGIGPAFTTPHHDPPPALADLARATRPRCAFPGCRLPARRCDLDHRIPYDHEDPAAGGSTCDCNLQTLCRTHHRLKTTGLLTVLPTDDRVGGAANDAGPRRPTDSLTWITRTGLRYTVTPPRATPPPAPDHVQPLLDALRRRSTLTHAETAWMNTSVRAAYSRGRRDASTEIAQARRDALDAEVRQHAYNEIADRNAPPDSPDARPDPPEPPDADIAEPAWMRRLLRVVPDDLDEPDAALIDEADVAWSA